MMEFEFETTNGTPLNGTWYEYDDLLNLDTGDYIYLSDGAREAKYQIVNKTMNIGFILLEVEEA